MAATAPKVIERIRMSALRRSLPLLVTTFINRCGTIGLSLLPMLLVEKGFSSGSSAAVMTGVKTGLLVGTYLGGVLSDRVGMKWSLVASFFLSGVGLGFLPFGSTVLWIGFWAVVTQFGQALFYSPARLLVVELVPPEEQQESMGWLKTTNNLGNIFSYVLGTLFAGLGVTLLILFDSVTSLTACIVGAWLLPNPTKHEPGAKKQGGEATGTWKTFVMCTLTVAGFYFLFDLFMVSTSARCRALFGQEGLRIFSEAMVLNTVLCTAFVVVAARRLNNPRVVFPVSILLSAIAMLLVAHDVKQKAVILVATLIITVAEILFTALAQFVLIRATPASGSQGAIYGFSLLVQSAARVVGSALAFPMIVNGDHPMTFVGVSAAAILVVSFMARP
jgi:MFS family permease